jgi:hypothetical protein
MTTTREHLPAFEALIEEHITLLGCTNDTARAAQLALCAQSAEPVQGEAAGRFCGEFGGDVNGNMWFKVKTRGAIPAPGAMLYTSPAKPDAELVELLTEARADLKAYIDAEYPAPMLEYPHNQRKRESDMDVVNRIDAKLAERVGSP